MAENRKATIIDVAKLAGVSVATVSRVVNGNYPVKPDTKKRVNKAIKELKYVPNMQARELNMQKSSSIGVVVPGLYNMFFAEVIDGIESTVQAAGYSLLLSCAQNDPEREKNCISALASRNVAGIIIISPNTSEVEEEFYSDIVARMPCVFINAYRHFSGASYVSNDEAGGTKMALEHFWKLGHRRIMFVRGVNSDSYQVKEEIYAGFMKRNEVFDKKLIVNIGEGNSVSTVDTSAEVLTKVIGTIKPTAIMCCNDLIAVGALNAANSLGLEVPKDLSIMGFDNISLSRFVSPKITTMDQNMKSLGSNAATLLREKIETGLSKRVVLENSLVLRESTGKAKK